MCRVSAPPLNAQRTKALIRANPVDHWVVTLGQRATTIVRPRNGWFEAPPGVPFVLSLGEEFASEREQDDRLQLYLPRDNFREIASLLDGLTGQVLDTPLGRLLGDYLLLLERRLPEMAFEDLARLTRAVGAMVASCVAPTSERMATAASQINLGKLERVRQAVRKHLRSPVLGTNMLCREVGMSRSQLYRLLEGEGWRVALHPAPAVVGESRCTVRPIELSADYNDRRGILFCRRVKLQPRVSAGVRRKSD